MGVVNSVTEWFKHWRCVLRHRPYHFTVHGTLLCRLCDAHLLEFIINESRKLSNASGANALSEFAGWADNGLAGRKPLS